MLDRVNVLIVPRANPDGAQNFTRGTVNGFDVNRDHLLQWTPEGRTLGRIFAAYQPAVVIDSHEFGVKHALVREVRRRPALRRPDPVRDGREPGAGHHRRGGERCSASPLARALDAAGFSNAWYFATSYDMEDRKVSMGGRRARHGTQHRRAAQRDQLPRRVARRRPRPRAHFRRRVESHLVATNALIDITARNAAAILALEARARDEIAAAAGQGEVVVAASATPGRNTLVMLDPETGADKEVEVEWSNALEIRADPCPHAPVRLPAARLAGVGSRSAAQSRRDGPARRRRRHRRRRALSHRRCDRGEKGRRAPQRRRRRNPGGQPERRW